MGYLRESSGFTRPSNTTAYASGDIVANDATSGGSGVVVPYVDLLRAGTALRILGGWLEKSAATVTNADFVIDLYSGGAPVPAKGDNEAYFASQVLSSSGGNYYRGSLAFANANWIVHSDRSVCFSTFAVVTGRPSILIGGGPSELRLYWILRATAAYTPASGETFSFTPHWEPVVDDPTV